KISQDQFEILRLAYKQSLNNALNEAIKYAAFYQIDTQNLKNQEKIVSQREQIVEIYNLKYNQGAVSLKDLLEAQNALISAQNTLASQKYELINDEINFYKAIAR
ncbi:MAG: outer membrane efflux protein, TolC family, partial [Candidatus Campylobacter infans]